MAAVETEGCVAVTFRRRKLDVLWLNRTEPLPASHRISSPPGESRGHAASTRTAGIPVPLFLGPLKLSCGVSVSAPVSAGATMVRPSRSEVTFQLANGHHPKASMTVDPLAIGPLLMGTTGKSAISRSAMRSPYGRKSPVTDGLTRRACDQCHARKIKVSPVQVGPSVVQAVHGSTVADGLSAMAISRALDASRAELNAPF